MIDLAVCTAPIELRLREFRVRAWLAALLETTSHLVRGTIHNRHLRLYSVPDGRALALAIWSDALVTIRVPGEPDCAEFGSIQAALAVLDAMLEHHVAARAGATQTAPASSLDGEGVTPFG